VQLFCLLACLGYAEVNASHLLTPLLLLLLLLFFVDAADEHHQERPNHPDRCWPALRVHNCSTL
jgi:hypothetical protein